MKIFRKIYDGNKSRLTPINRLSLETKIRQSEIPVEKKITKEQLQHLHNCIHFTHNVMKAEANRRIIDGAEQDIN